MRSGSASLRASRSTPRCSGPLPGQVAPHEVQGTNRHPGPELHVRHDLVQAPERPAPPRASARPRVTWGWNARVSALEAAVRQAPLQILLQAAQLGARVHAQPDHPGLADGGKGAEPRRDPWRRAPWPRPPWPCASSTAAIRSCRTSPRNFRVMWKLSGSIQRTGSPSSRRGARSTLDPLALLLGQVQGDEEPHDDSVGRLTSEPSDGRATTASTPSSARSTSSSEDAHPRENRTPPVCTVPRRRWHSGAQWRPDRPCTPHSGPADGPAWPDPPPCGDGHDPHAVGRRRASAPYTRNGREPLPEPAVQARLPAVEPLDAPWPERTSIPASNPTSPGAFTVPASSRSGMAAGISRRVESPPCLHAGGAPPPRPRAPRARRCPGGPAFPCAR